MLFFQESLISSRTRMVNQVALRRKKTGDGWNWGNDEGRCFYSNRHSQWWLFSCGTRIQFTVHLFSIWYSKHRILLCRFRGNEPHDRPEKGYNTNFTLSSNESWTVNGIGSSCDPTVWAVFLTIVNSAIRSPTSTSKRMRKLDQKSEKNISVGYRTNSKAWRFWNPFILWKKLSMPHSTDVSDSSV